MSVGRDVADAVLHEGYILYPYRASSTKNRFRWIFGVLAPRAWSEAGGCEPSWMETQCLLEGDAGAKVHITFRCLHLNRRQVERAVGDAFVPVDSIEADGRRLITWDEGEVRELSFHHDLREHEASFPFSLPEARRNESFEGGRVCWESLPLTGILRVRAEDAGGGLRKLVVRVENTTSPPVLSATREDVLPLCFPGSHLLLNAEHAQFVSVIDPPAWAAPAAQVCRSTRAFPVLIGSDGERHSVLAAPLILPDYPRIAPESPGDFFDSAEIDELLVLRTSNLTEDERREARATDSRAAAILDRAEWLPRSMMERLHGALRDIERAEMVPRRSRNFVPGMRVRLRAGGRRTDAQDLLYQGRVAVIREIRRDVDDREMLGVIIEGDPAAELHEWYGRYHYYGPDEVEPLS